MKEIFEIITTYGLETVFIALLVNMLTSLVKLPIKFFAKKLNDYTKITRFIVFLPIGFGFLLSFIYARFIVGVFNFDRAFSTMWLTSSSLSLTFYAIFEKLFPSKKKMLSDCEIKTSERILENIKELLEEVSSNETIEDSNRESAKTIKEDLTANKIILRGKTSAEVNVER